MKVRPASAVYLVPMFLVSMLLVSMLASACASGGAHSRNSADGTHRHHRTHGANGCDRAEGADCHATGAEVMW